MTKDKLWETYTRTLKAVRTKNIVPPLPRAERRGGSPAINTDPVNLPPLSLSKETKLHPITLERTREKSLRQGALDIDAKLDLHGLTQPEAFTALAKFMRRCVKSNKRQLLIITGKGSQGTSILRANLQNWLAQLPEARNILAIRPAALKHGGTGAFYILLRKK